MRVEVRLLLSFEEKAPHGSTPFDLVLAPGSTVAQALKSLSIPASAPKVIIVNGRVVDRDRELIEGDQITIFPPVEGG